MFVVVIWVMCQNPLSLHFIRFRYGKQTYILSTLDDTDSSDDGSAAHHSTDDIKQKPTSLDALSARFGIPSNRMKIVCRGKIMKTGAEIDAIRNTTRMSVSPRPRSF